MFRYVIENLKDWLNSESRKPLVLRGARQVGKTWSVRTLANIAKKNLVEINFERRPEFIAHFESNDPAEIILNLQSALNQSIVPEETILFLDEIQAAPELLAKLRWFYEEMPTLAVVAAGSLLEFVLEAHTFSMPVGRIQYAFVEPLGFDEFLFAIGEKVFQSAIETASLSAPLNAALHDKANALFKLYMTVGGMPEAVSSWIETGSLEALSQVHHNLINTYRDDFAKYAKRLSVAYLDDVLTSLPRLLTKKIIYSQINSVARHAAIKQATALLSKARLCHKVGSVAANGIPVGAELNQKVFKMIMIDVGLVSSLLGINLYQFKSVDEIMHINKGGLTEQVVGQLLRLLFPFYQEPHLYYWTREAQSASAEIDYLIQNNQYLVPVEVKAGSEGKLRSLHQFMSEKPWKMAVRIYAGPLMKSQINTKTTSGKSVSYTLLSVPFYMVGQLYRLLNS
jgi:uncharacterized protein